MEVIGELKLTGNTLIIYLYLLKHNSVKPSDVRKALNFKSTSSVIYHLEKLVEAGLVERRPGGIYKLKKLASIGPLSSYKGVFGFLIPKQVPYAVFFLVFTMAYVLLFYPKIDISTLFLGMVGSIIFIYESIKAYMTLKKLLSVGHEE